MSGFTRKQGYACWTKEFVEPTPEKRRADRPTDPHLVLGFWRVERAKTKADEPVAIWADKGEDGFLKDAVIFQFGDEQPINSVEHKNRIEGWLRSFWLSAVAVTQDEWSKALNPKHRFWSDGKPSKDMSDEEKHGIEIPEGENAPPKDEALADQIKALAETIDAKPEPTTQDEANALTGLLDRMNVLLKAAETEFEAEYRPHKARADEISAKWKAIGTPGRTAHDKAKERRAAFLRKEQARLDREAREENARRLAAAEAERKRIAEETAARLKAETDARAAELAAEGDVDAPVEEIPSDDDIKAEAERQAAEAVAPVETVEARRATAGTAFGRSTGLRAVPVGTITDALAFATYLVKAEDPDLMAALNKRAKQLAKARVPGVPGVQFDTETK